MANIAAYDTRRSAVADKPRDAFVQMQWRGMPRETYPCVTTPDSSFPVKGCGNDLGVPQNWGRWGPAPWVGRVLDPLQTRLSPCRSLCWIWSLMVKRCERMYGDPPGKNWLLVSCLSLWNCVTAFRYKKLEWWGRRAQKKVWWYLRPFGQNKQVWHTVRHRSTTSTAFTHYVQR